MSIIEHTLAENLSLEPSTNLLALVEPTSINRSIGLASSSTIKTVERSTQVESIISLSSLTDFDSFAHQQKPSRTIQLVPSNEITSKEYEHDVFKGAFRSVKARTSLKDLKALTDPNKLKACIKNISKLTSDILLGRKRSTTILSSRRARIEALRKHNRLFTTFSRSDTTLTLTPSVTSTVEKNKKLSSSISLVSSTFVSTTEAKKNLQRNIQLIPSTFLLSAQTGLQLGRSIQLKPRSLITKTTNIELEGEIQLAPYTELFNIQDVTQVENTVSLTPETTLSTKTLFESPENTLSLTPSTEIENLRKILELSSTISLSAENFTSYTKNKSIEEDLSLSPSNEVTTLQLTTVDSTLSLTPSSVLYDLNEIIQLENTIQLNPLNELITTFETKNLHRFIVLKPETQILVITELFEIANSTSLNGESIVETITEFINIENSLTLDPTNEITVVGETITVENSLSLDPSTQLKTQVTSAQLAEGISLSPETVLNSVEAINSSTSISLVPSVTSVVIDTFFSQPVSDVSVDSGWFNSDQGDVAFSYLNSPERDDSTSISTFNEPINETVVMNLGSSAGPYENLGQEHLFRVRTQASSQSGAVGSLNLTVKLISNSQTVFENTYTNVPSTMTEFIYTLTSAQINNLVYNDLSVELVANTTDGSNKSLTITWVRFDVPEVEQ